MSSPLVPNLAALLAALQPGSPGVQAAAAFDADSLAAAREQLRMLVTAWEQPYRAEGESAE